MEPACTDKRQTSGWRRIVNAARFSSLGLLAAWRREAAFRQELALVLVFVPVAVWVDVSRAERALLFGSLGLILVVELLNSALEALTDLASPHVHPLAGAAKDMGSAAVLIALTTAAIVWTVILWL